MANQEQTSEKKGIDVFISYATKEVKFEFKNPKQTIKESINGIKEAARSNPEALWEMQEMDSEGARIMYYFARKNANGDREILKEIKDGEIQSLFKYGVQDGDKLFIVSEPAPAAY